MLHCKTCVHLSRTSDIVHHDVIDHSEDVNSIGVQHIIITTEGTELTGEMSDDIEMTQVQVVQSETGELAVTMLVGEDGGEELQLVREEGMIEVVREGE